MIEKFIFAGFGGQGIMLMGKLMSYAAMKEDKYLSWMPSYGAEVRGGTAHSMVVISSSPIASPIVKNPTICVVMNMPSFQKYEQKVEKKGLLIVNGSLIEKKSNRTDIDILAILATDMAVGLGNPKVANMIILGLLVSKRKILKINSLIDSLEDVISSKHADLIKLNELAIRKGYEYGSR